MNLQKEFGYLDSVFEPIVVVGSDRKIVYYNHFFSTFFKASPRVLKKIEAIDELIAIDEKPLLELLDQCFVDKETVLSGECRTWSSKNDDFEYITVLKLTPVTVNEDDYCMICFNDVSVERTLHDKYRDQLKQLQDTHNQIVQADKLTTLGELTAGISHEINNPLTVASGSAEIIEILLESFDGENSKESILANIKDVRDSLGRINSIIVNMKTFLYQSEDKKEYCDLEGIVDASMKLVQSSFSKSHISLSKQIDDENIVGLVNKIKIEQVVVNLLKNAHDAIKDAAIKDGEVKVIVRKSSSDRSLNIIVQDNGPGIANDIHKEIFTPFYTTKEVGEGTGLGLSISSRIIEGHQGKLIFEGNHDRGVSFKISLPIIEVSSYTQNEKFLSGIVHKEGLKILVVDDEVQVLNVLNQFLESEEWVFIGSTNGEEALKVLKNIDIDLIISDYTMPGMNGSEFSQKVRELDINCPIFYMTSLKNVPHFQEDRDKHGVTGVILKPFTKEEVLKAIRSTLEVGTNG